MSEPVPDDLPTIDELLALVERLDADNERLRMKALELGRLVEDAVTAQVAGERRILELDARIEALDAELQALANTRVVRMSRPFRAVYARALARREGRRG
jgi:hypothetical protein